MRLLLRGGDISVAAGPRADCSDVLALVPVALPVPEGNLLLLGVAREAVTGTFVPLSRDSLSLVLLMEVPGWGGDGHEWPGEQGLLGQRSGVGLLVDIFYCFLGGMM